MEKKKKIKKACKLIIVLLFVVFKISSNIYATVSDELAPMREGIMANFTSLTTTIIIMLGVFAILGIIYKLITHQKIFKNKFASNKLVRFIEVTIFTAITAMMIYEFFCMDNIYIKYLGIVIALFAFYQRVSNKNRKWAYTAFIIEVIIYAIAIIFTL